MRNFLFILNIIICCVFFCKNSDCQKLVNPELKSLFIPVDTLHSDFVKPIRESKNEINTLFSVAFFSYKKLLSSQDVPRCIFTPSCSEYAIESFNKKGVFIGWLGTFDRLSRCHGFVKSDCYPFDEKKKHFYDPVN